MSSQFGFIDIILLAMFAGFIILRLRNILGRKTGHQGKPMSRYFPKGMEVLKDIERSMGRGVSQKGMNDRVIDLDLLLFGDLITENNDFVLPSSDIEEYLFVLEPLVELAGELLHPVLEVSFSKILEERFI